MRIISLIGSLTAGATIAAGLFQLPIVARVALLVVAVVALLIIRSVKSRARNEAPRVTYIVDKDSERYSGDDVAEFFAGLSRAKANTTPSSPSSASHRLDYDDFDER